MELFLIGLAIGLLLFFISIFNGLHNKKKHRKEIAKIKSIVTQKMDIESDSLSRMKEEIESLKKQNENLRISVRTLSQKPNRKEMTRLQIYQRAIESLSVKAPGFSPAWHSALKESEEEFNKVFFGFEPFMKKVVPSKLIDMFDQEQALIDDKNSDDSIK